MSTQNLFSIRTGKLPIHVPQELLQNHNLTLYIFKDPLSERSRIKAVTKGQVGAYIWIGKSLSKTAVRTVPSLFDYEITFLPSQMSRRNIYVGCAFGDLYTRIIHYFHNHKARTSPMIRYLKASGGVSSSTLLVFVITGADKVPVSVIGQLEYYLMQKLSPDINSNLYSLVPPQDNLGRRVYVYDELRKVLLYRFRDVVSLVRATSCKHDTIIKHIKTGTLLLGAFYVSLSPLPDISDTPSCTEQSFIKLAEKARQDHIAKPGGLYGKDKCKEVYVYNADQTSLLAMFPSKDHLEKVAKISHISVNKFIKSGAKFLNSFIIRSHPLPNISLKSSCSESAFVELAKKAREDSRGCKVLALNTIDPTLDKTFITRILLAKHFEISISTVSLYLKTGNLFQDQWEFIRLQKR